MAAVGQPCEEVLPSAYLGDKRSTPQLGRAQHPLTVAASLDGLVLCTHYLHYECVPRNVHSIGNMVTPNSQPEIGVDERLNSVFAGRQGGGLNGAG